MIAHMTRSVGTTGVVPPLTVDIRCRMARQFAGMEQTDLADVTGLSRRTIGNYERGVTTPRRAGLVAIALATGVDLAWLEHGKTPAGDPDGGSQCVIRDSNPEPADLHPIVPYAA